MSFVEYRLRRGAELMAAPDLLSVDSEFVVVALVEMTSQDDTLCG